MKKEYPKPSVTTDVVLFSIINNDLKLLLVKRAVNPFRGKWALPGGFVKMEEDLEQGAKRELLEETGVEENYLEQLYTFGDPKRDPRGRVITVAYFALINAEKVSLNPATDVSEAKWFSYSKLPVLSFDHKKIVDYALQRLRWKFEYTPIAFSLLPKKFTMTQLQRIYEIVFKKKFDKRNFRKKVLSFDILKQEEVKKGVSYRPPQLYSLKSSIPSIIEIL